MQGFWICALAAIPLFAGCGSSPSSDPEQTDPGNVAPAKPVSAENFCGELAKITCAADVKCCGAMSSTEGDSWPSADGGAGTSGSSNSSSTGCVVEQTSACRGSLGELVTDPRTGYDASIGGGFIEQVKSNADACYKKPIDYASLTAAFRGTGAVGAACTPEESSLSSLRASALSCKQGSRCRIYLGADGSPDGVCKPPEEDGADACSHPFDCPGGQWCELPGEWKPGVWGQCRPLRTAGWKCATDLECASQYCDASNKCAESTAQRFCLTVPYASEIKQDAPLAYLRLGDKSGTSAEDASGNGHSGKRLGNPKTTSPGALIDDNDDATAFDGLDDGVTLSPGKLSGSSMSVEFWMKFGVDTKSTPLVTFTSSATSSKSSAIAINDAGSLVADLVGSDGQSHVLDSKDAKPKADDWHHVVVSYDGYHAVLTLDGTSVATLDDTFTPSVDGTLQVGFEAIGIAGAIDEIAVYGSALGLARVREHNEIGTKGPARALPIYSWFK